MRKNRAFTLIELLVVISIIAVLAKAKTHEMRNATILEIRNLEVALRGYNDDCARFPADQCSNWTDVPTSTVDAAAPAQSWYYQLRHWGLNPSLIDFPSNRLSADRDQPDVLPLDLWKRPFVYVLAPGRRSLSVSASFPGNRASFNLFSLAQDGRCGSCGPFLGGTDTHDTTAAKAGAQSQKHIGGSSLPGSDDLGNW